MMIGNTARFFLNWSYKEIHIMSTLKVDAIRHNSATSDAITTASDGTCTAKLTSVGGLD